MGNEKEMDYRDAFSRPISPKEFDHKGHLAAVKAMRKAAGLETPDLYRFLGWNDAPLHFRGKVKPFRYLKPVNWCGELYARLDNATERSFVSSAVLS